MDQVVLSESKADLRIFENSVVLLLPIACALTSVLVLLLDVFLVSNLARRSIAKLWSWPLDPGQIEDNDSASYHSTVQQQVNTVSGLCSLVDRHGTVRFVWKTLRLLACVILVALTILAVIVIERNKLTDANSIYLDVSALSEYQAVKHASYWGSPYWSVSSKCIEISFCIFYAYSSLLAASTLVSEPRLQRVANIHLVVLLLIALGVYSWRDLLPLATFERRPADAAGGWLTWSRIGILTFAAVIVPVCVPRTYAPLGFDESSKPNPEQTAPLLSLILHDFISPLVWTAYRCPKLEYEQLPPLADYDRAAFLKQRSFHKLDPLRQTKPHHLFWGMVKVFRREYCIMAIMVFVKVLTELAGPVGIRLLLRYLEDPSQPGYIRPWVWIIWLFLGPVIGAIAMQWYVFITTGMGVRIEGMVTQLLFEHSLRARLSDWDSGGNAPLGANTLQNENIKANTKPQERKTPESNLVGKLHNLMSVDLSNISRDFLFVLLFAPVRIGFNAYFLYWILGWSALIGLLTMLLLILVPSKVVHLIHSTQVEWMKKADARVQFIIESINGIRMIKLFAWEQEIKTQSEEKRGQELRWHRKRQFLGLITMDINYALPLVVMAVTFASHTLWFKKPLDASTVFSSIAVFDILRTHLRLLFLQIPSTIQSMVSLNRINEFLTKTKLSDTQGPKDVPPAHARPSVREIGICNTTFIWKHDASNPSTIPNRSFKLHIDQEVLFPPGKINMVVGPTGCGKTSLLMALLGRVPSEMHPVPNGTNSWVSLPREGGVAYAAQEAWIQNETIRENVLFGLEYQEERYQKAISQCALDADLKLLDAGDQTEVGEKGVTLSGGQKARVSLARAIYSKAEVILLDDVLSALDVHTSRWIVNNCFGGDLVAGRTVIIVTHNVAMVSEVADFVVSLGPDGRIVSQGSVDDAFRSNPELRSEAEKEQELERKGEQVIDESNLADKIQEPQVKKSDGKLTIAEQVAEGHVGWPAMRLFLLAMGGIGFWFMYAVGFVLSNVAVLLQTYWLGVWTRAYNNNPGHPERVDVSFYLGVYGVACICGVILYSIAFTVHVLGSVRASRRIHHQLVTSILGAPLYWIDSTPIGRIISRFTQDMRSVDGALPNEMENLIDMTLRLLSRFIAIILVSPAFTLAGAILLVIGVWIGQIYIKAQLSVKRLMSNARSPMYSYFSAALAGVTTIRAYGVEEQFKNEAMRRIDRYTRAARTFWNLNRWIAIRMDALGGLFSAGLAAYLVYFQTSIDASDAGFSLNMAVALSGGILWWVRGLNEFEVQSNSLERIQQYLTIDQEPASTPAHAPPAHWPSSGSIVVEDLTARYTPDGPAVLHGLSFEIKSGERVGVVGRTGSGKSSLMLSLLRMIPTEGNIYYDGIPTHSINLDALRSNITIIPQHPELTSGTIRQNLDPFGEHDDATLHAALDSAGLNPDRSHEGSIGLDSVVSAGGSNFSLGQRQMLALARAIVRRSKVVVLDEATAAIDYETDTAIQRSIRTELGDRTLIIVAHRLQTICDADKVMVLDAGKIVEFDSPAALLRKDTGAFKSLVDKSGDRDALYAMAKGHA